MLIFRAWATRDLRLTVKIFQFLRLSTKFLAVLRLSFNPIETVLLGSAPSFL